MPTWGELLNEIKELEKSGEKAVFDRLRRRYLANTFRETKRDTILYAAKFTQGEVVNQEVISINDEDIQGFMEVMHGLKGSNLDLIIHSPGGSAESAEAILHYLRTKYTDIRIIIPHLAMSAATMIACGSDIIMMGKHSFIGPIDPQILIPTPFGLRLVPANAIIKQRELAVDECKDPDKLGSWIPILPQYVPALIIECQNAIDLSKELVTNWLKEYMFKNDDNPIKKGEEIALILSDEQNKFKSHSRHISREQAKSMNLKIEDLESNQKLQDLFLSIFHATTHTFTGTDAVKIIENHNGKAFIRQERKVFIPMPTPQIPEKQ